MPEVKWFKPEAEDKSRGHTFRDGVIWLSAAMKTKGDVIYVAAHEVRHNAQDERWDEDIQSMTRRSGATSSTPAAMPS